MIRDYSYMYLTGKAERHYLVCLNQDNNDIFEMWYYDKFIFFYYLN